MKRTLLTITALAMALCFAGCKKKSPVYPLMESKPTKIADYLYLFEIADYNTTPPEKVSDQIMESVWFGCSSVRNGNFYGRNLDYTINENCEFIVRTTESPTIKYASIGVANTVFNSITDADVEAGLTDEQRDCIPWFTMDGINDAGVVCNLNRCCPFIQHLSKGLLFFSFPRIHLTSFQ